MTAHPYLAIAFLFCLAGVLIYQARRGLLHGVMFAPKKWLPDNDSACGYDVHRADAPFSFWPLFTCYVALAALCLSGVGRLVNELMTPVPLAPTYLRAVALDHQRVEISWLSPSPRVGPERYAILRGEQAGPERADAYARVGSTTNPPYVDTTVQPATRYYYRVVAIYTDGSEALSNEDSTVTNPPPVGTSPDE